MQLKTLPAMPARAYTVMNFFFPMTLSTCRTEQHSTPQYTRGRTEQNRTERNETEQNGTGRSSALFVSFQRMATTTIAAAAGQNAGVIIGTHARTHARRRHSYTASPLLTTGPTLLKDMLLTNRCVKEPWSTTGVRSRYHCPCRVIAGASCGIDTFR